MPAAGRLSADIFAELATAHRQRVLRFATAFLGDRHLAEDIVQEALKRLFEHRHRYRLEELFGPYLVKTAARLCIDHRRSRQAEQRRIASLQAATAVSPAAQPKHVRWLIVSLRPSPTFQTGSGAAFCSPSARGSATVTPPRRSGSPTRRSTTRSTAPARSCGHTSGRL